MKNFPILVVDDDAKLARMSTLFLRKGGFEQVLTCLDGNQAIDLIRRESVGTVLLDLTMPDKPGQELLGELARAFPDLPIIVMTGIDDTETVVQCIKGGAFDYLVKPVNYNRLIVTVRAAQEVFSLRHELSSLNASRALEAFSVPPYFEEIVTRNRSMLGLFQYIEAIARTDFPVLLLGETGTGKELFAKAVHRASRRRGPFIAVNVAGLDDNVFSDTIFGHTRGAFTGADRVREGMIARAQGGTLFLDEIGDLYPHSQVKLLRLIQEGEFFPLGSDKPLKSDARILAATNRDLPALMGAEKFRADLYYRLCSHVVEIPPLRDRLDDVPLLVEAFIREARTALDKAEEIEVDQILPMIDIHSLSGNVRELRGLIFDLVARDLPRPKTGQGVSPGATAPLGEGPEPALIFPKFPTLKDAETRLVHEALRRSNDKQGPAAKLLGISRQALNQRLKRNSS